MSDRRRTREAAARAAARRRPREDAPTPAESRLDKVERPDGPWGAGVVLTLLSRREPPNRLFETLARGHGPVAHYKMAGEHVYLLSDPDLITEVFLTRAREVMKGRGLQAARPLLGNGLLTSEGEFHLRQRRLAQPAFHKQRIAAYADDMVRETLRHQESWRDGEQVEMVDEMTSMTFAIVGRTLFGTDLTGDAQTFGDTLEELMSGFGQFSAIGNERLVRAPLARIFEIAREVEHWPAYLSHYRYVRFRHHTADGGGLVEMAANRPFGVVNWPTWWLSEMAVNHDVPWVRYRHVGGVTTRKDVEWN